MVGVQRQARPNLLEWRECGFVMSERPPVRSGDYVAAAEKSLLATKLHIPTPPADRVARPRLAALLDAVTSSGLVPRQAESGR